VTVQRLRILCCLNRDLASNVALNLLLPTLAAHEALVGLTERVGRVAGGDEEPYARRELRAAEQSFPNDVLFPLLDAAGLPDNGSRYLSFNEIQRLRGIPVEVLGNPNGEEGLGRIRGFAPDLIVTVRYGAILKAPVISIPRLGVLNLHSGVLPDYRGVLATFRALMAEDPQIGCTLHFISDGTIDTGGIVGIARQAVDPQHSLLWHVLSVYPPGVEMIARAISQLAAGGALVDAPQSRAEGRYFTYPTAAEWSEFGRRGWQVAHALDLHDVAARYLGVPAA
jgi:methionyl-tRNA formyltransferase